MTKSFEQFNQEKLNTQEPVREVLVSENYEEVSSSLDEVMALQKFRSELQTLPFGSFYDLVEDVTNLNKATFSKEEKASRLQVTTETAAEKINRFSPRVADLYSAILSQIKEEIYDCKFEITKTKLEDLVKENDLLVLFDSNVSWDIKLKCITNRLAGYLSGVRALDKREGNEMSDEDRQEREEKLKKMSTHPPERRNESKPGVDAMDRLKEGERVPAIWSIYPAYGGYYKTQSFSKWDSTRNIWFEDEYVYNEAETVPLSKNKDPKNKQIDITMSAKIHTGQWVGLSIPYTHDLHTVKADNKKYQAQKDQNGDLVILIEGDGEIVEVEVFLAPNSNKKFISSDNKNIRVPEMPSEFSVETNSKLEEINNKKRGNVARASAIKKYVVSRITYLAPKNKKEAEYYNNIYQTSPKGFAGAVDEIKKADCDVANTYFATLCAKLSVPVRHVVGHSVQGKDNKGASNINSGTGHGWSEVYDEIKKEWIRMDATSAGDPNLEENKGQKGEAIAGDYGGQEAVRPTDEQLEELRKKLAQRKEELSYTKEERQLAEGAKIELKEARQIVKEIQEAENTRLPNGELVVDVLSKLFNAIIESRKTMVSTYDGPVRKREGGEKIENIVRHQIGIRAGDADPLSREKPAEEIAEEKLLGGLDLYLIGDKSGSMNSGDDETLWKMQRRAEYLIFSSLYRFERNLERAGLQKENALSVRTQGISFRGNGKDDIDLDKPLSATFTAQDKVKMWHSLTNQGSGNGDVSALKYVFEQIKTEIAENINKNKKDNRLRIVIACSDGGPDSPEGVQEQAESLGRLDAVVVGMGLTETAASVPIIYDTPYSRGDIAKDINDLPSLVAKHVILEAIKLFPAKAREGAKKMIEGSLTKFKK